MMDQEPDQPTLPYPDPETGRSSGWSGSSASADRARFEDTAGITSARQRLVLRLLGDAGARGLTWRDLAGTTGMHHGQASGVLSNLHHGGRIERLADRRHRCHIYVLPEHVGDRATEGPNSNPRRVRYTADDMATAWARGYAAAVEWLADITNPEPDNPYEQEQP